MTVLFVDFVVGTRISLPMEYVVFPGYPAKWRPDHTGNGEHGRFTPIITGESE